MSMFTAIYCSRVIFNLAERKRWIKKLTMTQLLDAPNINLIGMRKFAAIASLLLIGVGVAAVASRNKGIFDIDFLGGTSVQAQLKQPMTESDVYARLTDGEPISKDISLTEVKAESLPGNTCLLYTSPSPRDATLSRMPSSA